MSIFERYAPFIQDFIYQNDWESLRAIQVAAGDAIFHTDENVLLSASTASGKTEAAFFPILTLFSENPPTSVGAIYIGPLKALINDQFLRLNDLCAEADIPVWHWHGDVSQSHKAKMMKHPSGILQITPESLEAMLLHKHAAITKLFHDLRFIVIDEVHSLMRGDRGGQTICLIERLCRMAGVNPRRIGLSATIGDLEATGKFLAAGTGAYLHDDAFLVVYVLRQQQNFEIIFQLCHILTFFAQFLLYHSLKVRIEGLVPFQQGFCLCQVVLRSGESVVSVHHRLCFMVLLHQAAELRRVGGSFGLIETDRKFFEPAADGLHLGSQIRHIRQFSLQNSF